MLESLRTKNLRNRSCHYIIMEYLYNITSLHYHTYFYVILICNIRCKSYDGQIRVQQIFFVFFRIY